MRLFVAIELGPGLRAAADAAAREIVRFAGGRAVRPENLHITMRFLGETDPGLVPAVRKAMTEAVSGMPPLMLGAGRPGFFRRGRECVAWLGLSGDLPALRLVYERLEKALAASGFAREDRSFAPHLTLVREARADRMDRLETLAVPEAVMAADRLTLMESLFEGGRLRYIPRETAALGGTQHVVVDRIEGDWALCRTPDGALERRIHRSVLPGGCSEGDALILSAAGVAADIGETLRRREAARAWLTRWTP